MTAAHMCNLRQAPTPDGEECNCYSPISCRFHNWRPHEMYVAASRAPIGCICPPGANKECERVDCPRKGGQR